LILPASDKKVPEKTYRPLDQQPTFIIRPKSRQFASRKSRADADRRIVTGYFIAPKTTHEATAEESPCRPAGLDSDESQRALRDSLQQGS
jgi:hypothetical protein